MTAPGPNGAAVLTRQSSPVPELFAHQPPPRADGRLPITITHLEMVRADWTERGSAPEIAVQIERVTAPTAAFYRELYDRVGRPWLWYERRLLSDDALQMLLDQPGHELHVARHDGELVGYFELGGNELVFFGLTLGYIGRRIGPWLLDHPRALDTYRKAGFRPVRSEAAELRDPRVLWPEVYRWPPK